ncbi:cell division protein ZapA [Aquirufa sp. HETE-83D]|uniref:Cell division protein ZapA n=1 Tax=Aquirufa esocilacus TaxID=3096513 RepID=A0ABW6DMR8_9BACT
MNPKIPCNLLVGIQSIALKVSPSEESCVRNAASLVNKLVRYYEKQTNSSDPAAVMAMVALDLAMCGLKFDAEHNSLQSDILEKNEKLLALAAEFTV